MLERRAIQRIRRTRRSCPQSMQEPAFTVAIAEHPGAGLLPDHTVVIAALVTVIPPAAFETFLLGAAKIERSEEHTSELQSLMRISYAVFCLKKKKHTPQH